MAHTIGPWTFELDDDGITDVKAVVFVQDRKQGRAEIAQIEAQPQVEANARLIAAAPELLTFVKQMHQKHAPSGSRQRCLSCGLDGNCCGTYLAADALIAKAEGH